MLAAMGTSLAPAAFQGPGRVALAQPFLRPPLPLSSLLQAKKEEEEKRAKEAPPTPAGGDEEGDEPEEEDEYEDSKPAHTGTIEIPKEDVKDEL